MAEKKEKTRVKFSLAPVQKHFEEITYNPEQLAFIQSPIEPSALYGIPGAGKTQSIIGRIIYQFLAGNFKKTSDYKLFTFSKRACSDFILKGRRYHPKMFQKSSIHTLHSLAGKLVYLIHQKQSSSKNSVIMAALYLFNKEANWPALREYEPLAGCKVIFVDESQDISDIQYKLIMKISEFYKVPVIMIGDPNQNIYQFQNGSDIYLLEHPGPKYYLIRNYRSTPAIVNVINAIRPWADLTPKMISENREWGHGEKPHVVVGTVPEVIANVVRRIRELTAAGMRAEEMAIIGPVKKSKPSADYYTNIGLSLFTNTLRDEGIPYVKHYEDGSDGDGGGGGAGGGGDVDREIEYKEGAINLFTIHGSKGLEFKVVFLLNFHLNTFGISPTEEDYQRFKYLWYVGLSRAAQYLFIYIDERKYGWYDLRSVRLEDVVYETRFPKLMPKLEFKEEIKPLVFSVTEILKSKKYMNDRLYHFFHEAIGERAIERKPLWDRGGAGAPLLPDSYEVDSYDEYKIYGIFMENVFNFYYHFERKIVPDFVLRVENLIKNTIEIPKKYNRGYGILKVRLPQMVKECITLGQIYQYKNILSQSEMELFSYVSALVENDYKRAIFLLPENSVISYPRERVMEKISWIRDYIAEIPVERHDRNLFVAILEMAIFAYQLEHETAYLWKEDLEKYVTRLQPHLEFIPGFAMECYRQDVAKSPDHVYQFHRKEVHRNLPIVGEFDMINCEAIVDLKFSQTSMERFVDQILMYYMIYDPTLTAPISLELWNILRGEKMIIRFDPTKIQRVLLMQILAKAIGQKLRNMIFIYDLETTGLLYTNGVVDIIERHVEEYGSRSVWSAGLMRPQTIPFIPFEVTRITGITKEMVIKEGDTLAEMKEEFENIFRYCEKPTFVAHNGNSFDHKILVEKGLVDPDQCKFIDSKLLLRLLIGNAAIADKPLGQIYQYYFPSPADQIGSHRAASDVEMLIRIFQKIGGNIDGLITASSP